MAPGPGSRGLDSRENFIANSPAAAGELVAMIATLLGLGVQSVNWFTPDFDYLNNGALFFPSAIDSAKFVFVPPLKTAFESVCKFISAPALESNYSEKKDLITKKVLVMDAAFRYDDHTVHVYWSPTSYDVPLPSNCEAFDISAERLDSKLNEKSLPVLAVTKDRPVFVTCR